jgi:hypothetical protein
MEWDRVRETKCLDGRYEKLAKKIDQGTRTRHDIGMVVFSEITIQII